MRFLAMPVSVSKEAQRRANSPNAALSHHPGRTTRRLLAVSHACVVPANQSVFGTLAQLDWRVDLVVPARWSHEYASKAFRAGTLPDLQGRIHPSPVALSGQPQRHFYRPDAPGRLLHDIGPDVALLEEETFSIAALQWAVACRRQGIPFGVQAAENLDRPLPRPARLCRAWTLRHAAFVAARSPTAKRLAERWGARGVVEVIPHAVPGWSTSAVPIRRNEFTIGFAGRLVPEKGLLDLVRAARQLGSGARVLLAGDGPQRAELAAEARPDTPVEFLTDLKHEDMAEAFRQMDVLVLPSRTTPTWVEQFGRVLVEALWCGVPVIGSSSGEIPWVIEVTGGGTVFPEGDVAALASALAALRDDPVRRAELARVGRRSVERLFSVDAVARQLDAVLTRLVRPEN